MYVSFAYSGWNAAAYIAGEVEKPEKTLPRALLLGTGAVMALYVLLNVIYFYAVPSDTLAGPPDKFAPVIEVGDAVGDRAVRRRSGGNLITSLIALALVSAVSAMIMAGPRVYAAMAADRALPPQLGWYSKRGVPTVAVDRAGRARHRCSCWSAISAQLMRFCRRSRSPMFAALTCRRAVHHAPRAAWRAPTARSRYPRHAARVHRDLVLDRVRADQGRTRRSCAVAIGVLAVGAVLYAVAGQAASGASPRRRSSPTT